MQETEKVELFLLNFFKEKKMIILEGTDFPSFIQTSDNLEERKVFEKALLAASKEDKDIRIDVICQHGDRTPTIYKVKFLKDEPKCLEDFKFELVDL